jgi:tetraacyldisaccharide 4'-kinase
LAILDDGFQHRRLHRDVDILIDAGIANGRMLPAGPLREPLVAAQRAHVIWARDGACAISNPTALRVEAAHEAVSLVTAGGVEAPIGALAGAPVVALAGLARPSQFIATLRAAGARVLESHLYPDHHLYSAAELERLLSRVRELHATLVTSEKDRERLPESVSATLVRMSVRITHGQAGLAQRLGFR